MRVIFKVMICLASPDKLENISFLAWFSRRLHRLHSLLASVRANLPLRKIAKLDIDVPTLRSP
jgi:hypothetical protein